MADSHAQPPQPPRRTILAQHASSPAQVAAPPGDVARSDQSHAHVNLERCRLSLIKGEHRWRFRWEPGSEAALISAVADLARNPRMNFDWFDAAVVCRHIAQGLPTHSASDASSAATNSPSRNK